MVIRFCRGAEELSIRKALRVNNVNCEGVFTKGDEELNGSSILNIPFCGSKYCGSTTATAATKWLFEVLGANYGGSFCGGSTIAKFLQTFNAECSSGEGFSTPLGTFYKLRIQ